MPPAVWSPGLQRMNLPGLLVISGALPLAASAGPISAGFMKWPSMLFLGSFSRVCPSSIHTPLSRCLKKERLARISHEVQSCTGCALIGRKKMNEYDMPSLRTNNKPAWAILSPFQAQILELLSAEDTPQLSMAPLIQNSRSKPDRNSSEIFQNLIKDLLIWIPFGKCYPDLSHCQSYPCSNFE